MSMYSTIYYTLCEQKKQAKSFWKPGSGIHRHHIIPIHHDGTDDDTNYTYLTVREHIIAHFLLWKIHKKPNDLRSMNMLGAKLTTEQRRIVGIWCRDNRIGFHSADRKQRAEWSKKGMETQKKSENQNTFYWWSTQEGRKKRASLGGKVGSKAQMEKGIGIHTDDKTLRTKYAKLGGKAIKGLICVTNGKHRTRIKPNMLEHYIELGYKRGFTLFSDT